MTFAQTPQFRPIGGRYERRRLLGQGGMACVYEAYDQTLGRLVALKQMHPALAIDQRSRDRFLREAQTAAGLSHPSIARVYDVGDDQEGPYLVQELVEGRPLDEVLPLPPEQAAAVVAELAEALNFIHSQGIVHCDIKPQNVMLTPESRPVLLDFGIAAAAGAALSQVLGTPHYLAPERATGAPPTPASDVYALGVMLYELLTGSVPIDGSTPQEIIQRHQHEGVPPLRQVAPGLAHVLEPIIMRATDRDPAARPTTAELAGLLRNMLDVAAKSTSVISSVPQRGTVPINNQPTAVVAAPAPRPVVPRQAPATRMLAALTTTLAGGAQKNRLRLLPLLLLPLLACVVLAMLTRGGDDAGAAVETATTTPSPAVAAVPELVGRSREEAAVLVSDLGLGLAIAEERPSDAPAGQVLEQQPAPGSDVPVGETISVVLSAGQPVAAPAPTAPPAVAPVPEDEEDDKEDKEEDKEEDKGKGKGRGKKDK